MKARLAVPMVEMILCLSDAVDMISRQVASHHRRVAFIAHSLAAQMGLTEKTANDLLMAGLVHDVGALTLRERLGTLRFEESAGDPHSELGFSLLDTFGPFADIALMVRYHHDAWADGRPAKRRAGVPVESHILHLADRVAVQIDDEAEILGQVARIVSRIKRHTPDVFEPDSVDALTALADKESFWLDAVSPTIETRIREIALPLSVMLGKEGISELSTMFGRVVDFRSRFTAVHTAGVAASCEAVAGLAGMTPRERWMMSIAGNLHDLGKLAVPVEIIEKPGRLSAEEYNIMKRHTFYTYRLLERLKGMEEINAWASFHHERLDGHGYPFNRGGETLSLGSRIMAVADVFTALTEDRPYRAGMDKDGVQRIMEHMAKRRYIDADVYGLLISRMDEVNDARMAAQHDAALKYESFRNVKRKAA